MRCRSSVISRVSVAALLFLVLLGCFPGPVLSAVVTLKSIELYTTHEWIQRNPGIYFQCSGEDKKSLPDLQEADVLYNFKGEESWQPLTELLTNKCKRCGIYEALIVSDHVFDEWELCSSDFAAPDGKYTRFKENEFNVTFACKECLSLVKDSSPTSEDSNKGRGKKHYVIPILLTLAVVAALAIISAAAFKYWQKKRRQQEQARFLKLFEDDDDLENEFSLNEML